MGLMLLVDLLAFSLAMTDIEYEEYSMGMFSCQMESWAVTRRVLTVSSLALVFSRGVLLWFCNLFLFISVLRLTLRMVRLFP